MPWAHWRLALVALVGAAYLWLGHLGSTSAHPPAITLVTGLVPAWLIALALAWNARLRPLWLGVLGLITLAVLSQLDSLRQNTAWVYFVQHAGTFGLLGLSFGRTLFGEHAAALCSRIAVFAHGTLAPHVARYTWQVTLAWTIFFLAVAALSVVLFALAPLAWWSVFANLLSTPLLGVMFAAEAVIRRRVLPGEHHIGILATIQAYREYARQPKPH